MLVGYMLETSRGTYDRPVPTGAESIRVLDAIIDEAVQAERAGFHAVFVPERHMRTDCFAPDGLTLLSALAVATKTIGLGTCATVLSLHNPMQLAERLAMIDILSGGRLLVTLARGFRADYWRMMGITPSHLTDRFLEGVEVVRRAWAGERFSFDGQFFSYDDVFLSPLPLQRPSGPPIWGGGHSAPAIHRAPQYAAAWVGGFFPIDEVAWHGVTRDYRAQAEKLGKIGFVALVRAGFVSSGRNKAVKVFEPLIANELNYYKRHPAIQPAYTQGLDAMVSMSSDLIIGSPADCVAALQRYESDLGVDYIIMRFRTPTGPSTTDVVEAIQLFGAEVLPFVQSQPSPSHPALPRGTATGRMD